MNARWRIIYTGLVLLCLACSTGAPVQAKQPPHEVVVTLDIAGVADDPGMVRWGQEAKRLIERWHPRICNLLTSKGFDPPTEVRLVIKRQDKGVGHASGRTITVMSGWIKKHPDDLGLVIHELTHVIQRYKKTPAWVTEGIADYIRWAVYEGKPLSGFGCPDQPKGYTKGYRAAAGFLLWLESDLGPGIVSRLNSAARRGEYTDDLFQQATGRPLDALWEMYRAERHP